MDIEILEINKMSQSGSSLLKLIQNNSLPMLDLFVRESVQNSLDAGLEANGYNSVYVNIGTKEIKVEDFAKHLSGITNILNGKFGNSIQKSLYIEDSNTVGLKGSLDFKKDPTGNIFKLVYGISMAQDAPGSGGSWGLGKTVYFRMGIGLVVYYSHTKNDEGKLEHRLAVTLVENEKLNERMIPIYEGSLPSGIAWWGQRISADSIETKPITDITLIREILHTLSTDMFDENKFGTIIIIPFINEEQLLIHENKNPNEKKPWEDDIESYLITTIQRWYSPRLDNKRYPGKYLNAHVNGEKIEKKNFYPLFYELQNMYNVAAKVTEIEDYFVENIQIRNDFENNSVDNAGRVVFKKFNRDELQMLAPNNYASPYAFANVENILGEMNPPLITFVRKPGMIVNYDTFGEWCKGISPTEKNEFLIGIYVPNSNIRLSDPIDEIIDLESYLRKSELADHTSWSDNVIRGKNYSILKKIRSNISRKITARTESKEEISEKQSMNNLARNVGKMLLPSTGFGRRASSNINSVKTVLKSPFSSQGIYFEIINQEYLDNNEIKIDFNMKISKKVNEFTLELCIITESGKVKANSWETDLGIEFPSEIINFSLLSVDIIKEINDCISNYNVLYGKNFKKNNCLLESTGSLIFTRNDTHVQISISVESK